MTSDGITKMEALLEDVDESIHRLYVYFIEDERDETAYADAQMTRLLMNLEKASGKVKAHLYRTDLR